jgi:hypothetical protein
MMESIKLFQKQNIEKTDCCHLNIWLDTLLLLRKSREKIRSYPVLEKVIIWVNIHCKASLKTKGDYGKSIIYTAKGNGVELEIYTNNNLSSKEVHAWDGL